MAGDKTFDQLYREREKRVNDAIELKIPDRIPVLSEIGYFAAKYSGITCEDLYYDYDKWLISLKKTLQDFDADMVMSLPFFPGKVLEMIDPRNVKWPGHGVSPHHTHQAVEGEFMKADEYDLFLNDFSGYLIRTYLPRVYGSLEPLKMLPPLSMMMSGYQGVAAMAEIMTSPGISKVIETLQEVGRELSGWRSKMSCFDQELKNFGFPNATGAIAFAPFDIVSDFFRGMRGSMLDMYRQPDKLLEACERILPMTLGGAVMMARMSGNPRVFLPLHRGADSFMSNEQFETFYWPSLKKVLLGLIDEGLTPSPFFEGNITSRLEYLLELPRGKVLVRLDKSDMFRAKDILKDHMCIMGNVHSSLLQTANPQDVKDYCKKLIDIVGKDGGFIMAPSGTIDDIKPENLHAMIDFTKEYGVYH